jgi:(p)ppGpp synthase/HD superfamily hydrolase
MPCLPQPIIAASKPNKERAMSTRERALEIAREVHRHQVDKGGAPYLGHPVRVANRCVSDEARIVALLHDVVEDGAGERWTFERLRAEGFSEAVVTAVDAVTKRAGEDYADFVRRAAQNALAREVKLADIADNMDLSRIAHPSPKDLERLEKYRLAKLTLLAS